MDYPTIRGYRPLPDAKPEKQFSVSYLHPKTEAVKPLVALHQAARENGTPCMKNPEAFIGDELPTDEQAAMMCARCPVFDLCEDFSVKQHPSWGVHAGRVYGRKLKEEMENE